MPQFLLVPLFILAGIYLARRSRSESGGVVPEGRPHPGSGREPGKKPSWLDSFDSTEPDDDGAGDEDTPSNHIDEPPSNHIDENGVTWSVIQSYPDGTHSYIAGSGKYYGTMLRSAPSGIAAVVTSYLVTNGFMPAAAVDTSPITDRNGALWTLLYTDPSTGVISFSAMSGPYAGSAVNGKTRDELTAAIDAVALGAPTLTIVTESVPVAAISDPLYTLSLGPTINKA